MYRLYIYLLIITLFSIPFTVLAQEEEEVDIFETPVTYTNPVSHHFIFSLDQGVSIELKRPNLIRFRIPSYVLSINMNYMVQRYRQHGFVTGFSYETYSSKSETFLDTDVNNQTEEWFFHQLFGHFSVPLWYNYEYDFKYKHKTFLYLSTGINLDFNFHIREWINSSNDANDKKGGRLLPDFSLVGELFNIGYTVKLGTKIKIGEQSRLVIGAYGRVFNLVRFAGYENARRTEGIFFPFNAGITTGLDFSL